VWQQRGYFSQTQAAKAVDAPQSAVRVELTKLAELKMITVLPRERGQRAQYYLRADSPLWEIFRVTQKALADLEGRQSRRRVQA